MASMDCGVEEKNTMVSLAAGGDWCEEDDGVEGKDGVAVSFEEKKTMVSHRKEWICEET